MSTEHRLTEYPTTTDAYKLFSSAETFFAQSQQAEDRITAFAHKITAAGTKIDLHTSHFLNDPDLDSLLPLVHRGNIFARRAMLANIASSLGTFRKSGELYPTHPKMVGDILADLFPEDLELYILGTIHDSQEEGALRDFKNGTDTSYIEQKQKSWTYFDTMKASVETLNLAFPYEYRCGAQAILTVEPEGVGSRYMGSSDYAVFTRQLEEYGNEQIWCAALVDKACNI